MQEQKKEELKNLFSKKLMEKGIFVNKSSSSEIQYLFDFNSKEKQLQKDKANDFSYIQFFDPKSEQDRDIKGMNYIMKKYSKIIKLYYNVYGGRLRPNNVKLFEELSEKNSLMQSANVWKLLKDHTLDEFITVKQVNYIIQKVNAILKKQFADSLHLDLQTFQ